MTPSVRASLPHLPAGHFDLLIIGRDITGAGIAREAAQRGCKTALVEARDIGWGTSSRSSRLIHGGPRELEEGRVRRGATGGAPGSPSSGLLPGGLRYLEQGRLRLVFEALAERRVMLRLAPH